MAPRSRAPDTDENQQEWPQPKSQRPGCGWPLIKLAGIFYLSSGALLRAAHGRWKTSEAHLFALLRRILRKEDTIVADRGFWSFELPIYGFRLTQMRPGRLPRTERRTPERRGLDGAAEASYASAGWMEGSNDLFRNPCSSSSTFAASVDCSAAIPFAVLNDSFALRLAEAQIQMT